MSRSVDLPSLESEAGLVGPRHEQRAALMRRLVGNALEPYRCHTRAGAAPQEAGTLSNMLEAIELLDRLADLTSTWGRGQRYGRGSAWEDVAAHWRPPHGFPLTVDRDGLAVMLPMLRQAIAATVPDLQAWIDEQPHPRRSRGKQAPKVWIATGLRLCAVFDAVHVLSESPAFLRDRVITFVALALRKIDSEVPVQDRIRRELAQRGVAEGFAEAHGHGPLDPRPPALFDAGAIVVALRGVPDDEHDAVRRREVLAPIVERLGPLAYLLTMCAGRVALRAYPPDSDE